MIVATVTDTDGDVIIVASWDGGQWVVSELYAAQSAVPFVRWRFQ